MTDSIADDLVAPALLLPALAGTAAVLATPRLILRAPTLDDAAAIAALADDVGVAHNTMRLLHPYTEADALAFLSMPILAAGDAVFAVMLANGTLIGMAGFDHRGEDAPEIGYWFGRPYWGQGYASEAVSALVGHAFRAFGHTALLAGARVSNPASRRVLEKSGFRWTGCALLRIHSIGGSVPVDRFRLDQADWRAATNRPAAAIAA